MKWGGEKGGKRATDGKSGWTAQDVTAVRRRRPRRSYGYYWETEVATLDDRNIDVWYEFDDNECYE